jgi:hypothetical protein
MELLVHLFGFSSRWYRLPIDKTDENPALNNRASQMNKPRSKKPLLSSGLCFSESQCSHAVFFFDSRRSTKTLNVIAAVNILASVPTAREVTESHKVLPCAVSRSKVRNKWMDNTIEGLCVLPCSRYEMGIVSAEATKQRLLDASKIRL